MAPISRMLTAAIGRLPVLVDAYRSGQGVGWDAYGADMREGQAAFNRPAFTHLLGGEWLPAIEDVHERLQTDPPARIADIGCGEGWSTIAIARAYPKARVVGIDLDAPSIEAARHHAVDASLDGVEFRHGTRRPSTTTVRTMRRSSSKRCTTWPIRCPSFEPFAKLSCRAAP